jgi:formyltetrahydrofolate synthetase
MVMCGIFEGGLDAIARAELKEDEASRGDWGDEDLDIVDASEVVAIILMWRKVNQMKTRVRKVVGT